MNFSNFNLKVRMGKEKLGQPTNCRKWPVNLAVITAVLLAVFLGPCYASPPSPVGGQETLKGGSGASSNRLTESQKILHVVLDDIRDCNRRTVYGFDPKVMEPIPRHLRKLKGLRLLNVQRVNPSRLVARYRLEETYGEIKVVGLELSNVDSQATEPLTHTLLLEGNFSKTRQQLERYWNIDFVVPGGGRPGPEGPLNGEIQSYGYVTRTVDGNERTLSINHTSLVPGVTRLDCGQGY